MIKLRNLFKKKNKDKYNIGDTVFLLGYPTLNLKKRGKEIKLFKIKITEIIEDKDGIIYKTDIHTGLENENGGYTYFDDFDTIKKEINKFCKENFMDWECVEDE